MSLDTKYLVSPKLRKNIITNNFLNLKKKV